MLSIDFNDTINTSETKCLNTAIMIVVVLIGSEHFSTLDECSVKNTVNNMNTNITTNNTVITELKRDMEKSDSGMFYILITDGMLNKGSEQVYFPGHVFFTRNAAQDIQYLTIFFILDLQEHIYI